MELVNVKLPEHWLKLARSPFVTVITALTCLALTFAPFSLFYLGKSGVSYHDPRVILCFAAIVLVPLVYIRFAALCFNQVRADKNGSDGQGKTTSAKRLASVVLWSLVTISAVAIYFLSRPR